MRRDSFGRTATLVGTAVLALSLSAAVAAIVPRARAATPQRPARICAIPTPSFRQLAVIDKVGESDFQCLGVSLDGDAIAAIRLETHHFVSTGPPPDREQVKILEFPPAVFESSRGAVLDGIPGHDAIVLRGHFVPPPGRLALAATFLYNGFTDEYHGCDLMIDPSPYSGWRLADRFDQTISHIVVRTRQMPLIGDFGIANLDGACF